MKILICGDSFCATDRKYPGLHFSEKIAKTTGFDIINYSVGGSSNAMIATQLLQGLVFKPDFIIFGFTSAERYEYDESFPALLGEVTPATVKKYQQARYITNCYAWRDNVKKHNDILRRWRYGVASDNMEKLKNYLYISMCITTCLAHDIPFCFSTGGFENTLDYQKLLEENYVKNLIDENSDRKLPINLWDYHDGKTMSPCFHIADDTIQTQYADECIKFIKEELC